MNISDMKPEALRDIKTWHSKEVVLDNAAKVIEIPPEYIWLFHYLSASAQTTYKKDKKVSLSAIASAIVRAETALFGE
jgi:hypothetical protein